MLRGIISSSRRRSAGPAVISDPYFTNVSLLLKADGANDSTIFTDLSSNNIGLTANGNAKISTSQSKFGGSSAYFDGTDDYITSVSSSAFNFGTGDFTYEWWFKSSATNAYCAMLTRPYDGAGGIFISLNGSSGDGRPEIYWKEYTNALFFKSSLSAKNDNQWHHFAFTRAGTTCYMFIDGEIAATKSSVSTSVGTSEIIIGTDTIYGSGSRAFSGYIDDVRITKGVARYTAAFTPPTESFPDIALGADRYFSKTSLLLKADGANDSTIFTDLSSNNLSITANNDAKISTTEFKFGGSSAFFDGTGDYLSIPGDAAFNFSNGNFTVEFWYKKNGTPQSYGRIFQTRNGDWHSSISIFFDLTTDNLKLYCSINGSSWPISNISVGTVSASEWRHYAVVRNGNTVKCYQNGVEQSSSTALGTSSLYYNVSDTIIIGGQVSNPARSVNGYLDDLRVTKGVARYTTAFTPPTAAFPNS
jgi:hypothetical protein